MRRDISDGAVKAFGVVPVDPFQGFPFYLAHRFPGAEEVNYLGLDTIDRQGMQACPRGGPMMLSARALS